MKSLNRVELIGNLGADPETHSNEGVMLAKFSVATGETWLDKTTTEKRVTTEWHRVVCFNKLAEIVKSYLKKGSKVYLSGKLKTSKWQDKNNETRYTTEIVAEELIMLDQKSESKVDGIPTDLANVS